MRLLSAILFKATFEGKEILDALADAKGDNDGSYLAIKSWEFDLMKSIQPFDPIAYGQMPVEERANLIVSMKLSGWMEILQADKRSRKI